MSESLVHSWWILALRGLLALAFGVLSFVSPGSTLLALVALFAAYAFVTGLVAAVGAVRNRRLDHDWWMLLLVGLVSIGAGVVTLVHPGLTALVLVLVIAANALIGGLFDIIAAVRLRRVAGHGWLLMASGGFSLLFGVLAFLFPAAGALTLIWLISAYAVLIGACYLVLSYELQKHARVLSRQPVSTTGPAVMPVERRTLPDRRTHPHSPTWSTT